MSRKTCLLAAAALAAFLPSDASARAAPAALAFAAVTWLLAGQAHAKPIAWCSPQPGAAVDVLAPVRAYCAPCIAEGRIVCRTKALSTTALVARAPRNRCPAWSWRGLISASASLQAAYQTFRCVYR